MKAMLALIRFELERRWLALAGGVAMGIMVYLLPIVERDLPPDDLRTLAATVAALTFAVILAFTLGGSLVAADLVERRASFLFARPMSWMSIAAGRFLAAVLLVLGSTALVVLPSLVAGARLELPMVKSDLLEQAALVIFGSGLAVALLLLSSALVLAARARTAWIVLELSALGAGGLMTVRAYSILHEFVLPNAEPRLWLGIATGAVFALVAVFAVAVAFGRTDLARAHRAQAIAGSLLLLTTATGGLLWAKDYVSPSLEEIRSGEGGALALGDGLILVGGTEKGRDDLYTSFLLDGRTGWSVRAGQFRSGQGTGNDDIVRGGVVYFLKRDDGQFQLERVRATPNGFERSPSRLLFDRSPDPWAISTDGTLFAGLRWIGAEGGALLEVDEVESGRLVKSTHLAQARPYDARIEPEADGFRLVFDVEGGLQSWRIDRDGSAHKTADSPIQESGWNRILDGERSRLFLKQLSKPQGWLVLDAATLEQRALLRSPLLDQPEATLSFVLLLFPNGSVATNVRQSDRRELALFSETGDLIHSSTWPREGPTLFAGAGEERTLLVAWRSSDQQVGKAKGWTIDRFDLATGERRTVAHDLRPTSWLSLSRPRPAVLLDDEGHYFSLDADTGISTRLADPKGAD